MKALLINGSPRKDGNTAVLLDKVNRSLLEAAWETEIFQLGGKQIQGCRGCMKCAEKQNKRCIFDNDLLNGLLEKMLEADAMILGSPCYFSDMTAELKALVDRAGFVAYVNGGLFQGKIGAAVVAAGRGGATHTYDSINHMFLMSKMIVPGSIYWNMGYGDDKKDVLKDTDGIKNMHHLGRVIAWMGTAIAPHLQSCPTE